MTDYSLGRAHGKIEIDYSGAGAQKAIRDLDRTATSAEELDSSLTKTQKSLRETERELDSTAKTTRSYGDDVDDATESHERFSDSARTAAHAVRDLDDVEERHSHRGRIRTRDRDHDTDAMRRSIDELHNLRNAINDADNAAFGVSKGLHVASAALAMFGPEGRVAALGLERVATKLGIVSDVASGAGHHVRDFVKHIASFELGVGKISGLALGGGALGGLAGLGGAAGLMGVTQVAGAVRQLSGALGLLPAAISAAAFSMGTLKIAFHGVGDALKDMMADDPKKFLEDIKNMGPVAGKAMLQIAQFRNMFKLGAATIQDSFFAQVINDIQPLVQTWMPALGAGMSQVAGMYGQMAHQFAGLLMQPQIMQGFQLFIENISKGLQAMAPAMAPLLKIFTQLTVIGSSFFEQIGGRISQMLGFFSDVIDKAAQSGSLQRWIQSGIDGISHLINVVYSVGAAFNNIMDIADRFGGGGLLGWLDKVAAQLNGWTQSDQGQSKLIDFFTVLRQATDAFTPMLQPILEGLVSLGAAFTKLGIAIAPGWQTFFNTFAATMDQLGPSITGMAPALNQFLIGLSSAFSQLMAAVGPQLPQLFKGMSDSFVALLPQLQPLTQAFLELVNSVGPQLPKLFGSITDFLISTQPYWPIIIGFVRDFVTILTGLINGSTGITDFFTGLLTKLGDAVKPGLKRLGEDGGKALLEGLVKGLGDMTGINAVIDQVKRIMHGISDFFQHSPAKKGPFSGDGYTGTVGRKMITDMAAGMTAAAGSVSGAAASVMSGAAASFVGAPAAGGAGSLGGALLPDRIAGADNSILSAYLNHQFDENRGLKGFAKSFGQFGDIGQGLSDLASQFSSLAMGLLGFRGDLVTPVWHKTISDEELARRKNTGIGKNPPGLPWEALLGPGAANMPQSTPLNIGRDASSEQIQQAIISAGRMRGLSDEAIQTALAIAGDESGYRNLLYGDRDSLGIYQQRSSWGTPEQRTDPNYAINKFYEAFAKQLATTSDPFTAGVLTQNPQLGSGAASSDYAKAVRAQMERAGQILAQSPSNGNGTAWNDVLGLGPTPAVAGFGTPGMPQGVSNALALATSANGKPYDFGGAGDAIHQFLYDCSGFMSDIYNALTGQATGVRRFSTTSDFSKLGFLPGFDPNSTFNIGVTPLPGSQGHMAGTLAGVNVESGGPTSTTQFGGTAAGARDKQFSMQYHLPNSMIVGMSAGDVVPMLMGPDGKPISAPDFGIGTKSPGAGNLQRYPLGAQNPMLANYPNGINDPELASRIAAAQAPGASNEMVGSTLNDISRNIAQLKATDETGNADQIEALTRVQSTLSNEHGFTQQNPLQQIQQGAGNIGKVVNDVFSDIKSGVEALGATQDTTDRLVYGLRNSEDVVKIVENSQKWLTFASNIATTVADVANTVGDFAGMAPSIMGADEVGKAARGVSEVASIVSGAIQGVNQAITLGIQIYHVVGSYVGRFMSSLVGFGQGDLMGDIRYLLDTNTNQLRTYSEQNPLDKRVGDVPTWMRWYDHQGVPTTSPGVGQLNIYAGPGQSAAEMMTESMWMVNSGSLNGAMSAANF
ncbi:hypothetical protein ABW16_21585 [Mycolicibacter heraklionensis]|uniref:Tape measure protein n=1 Tax=Mycolicibacter heraklionensis TaxID=512402 RepID=A0ABR5FA98_9MYCO|nr:hypothetical protein [Mycolicibacter heraklionensis]KLO25904.1 hypothetical protein ABW16_21585 [Mycolicibacter heraklionensis]